MSDHSMGVPNFANWTELPFGELCLKLSRGTAPSYVAYSSINAIGQRCVQNAGFDATQARAHDARVTGVLWAQPGDVLLNSTGTGTIGRSCVFDHSGSFMIDGHVTVLRAKPSKVDPRWLNLALRSPWGQRHLETHCYTGSTNQIELSRVELARTSIPVPPLEEQRRIAEILDALDAQIGRQRQVIEKLVAVHDGLTAGLLSEVDADSNVLAGYLSSSPKNGYSPKEVDEWTGMVALGLGCLTPRGFQPRQLKNVPADEGRNDAAMLRDGDLLMSRANTRDLVGLVGIFRSVGSPCIYPDLMMRLIPTRNCRTQYLELVLQSWKVRRQIQSMAQGTSESMVKISSSVVQGLKVQIPSLATQDRILNIVGASRARISAEEAVRSALLNIKDGLAEDLLTGRVRVPEAEAVVESL
ncbi:restriction endonuclease subunit S [Actinomadura sp. BRA 177]|uniref:restriction endonuclease subunit S n=1 Tax=Actinomadura sp. BRA 177 TaxID=2745202 RepID=UPI001595CB69|nr:restriction endonuclease subunit S [Actinomadura sp. BRA 177]NVI86031.1 restriction endonuclease subunit S [Actinomadura sp. BRA 177]